jgi:hypothetical protein
VILKSVSTDVGTSTGTPPDNFTISKYETQYGAGKITSHHRLTLQCYSLIVLLPLKLQFETVCILNHCLFEFSTNSFF